MSNLIIIIEEYDIFGFPYLITYPSYVTYIYLDNILKLGILTLLNYKNPLSLALYPNFGPISPTTTPCKGL